MFSASWLRRLPWHVLLVATLLVLCGWLVIARVEDLAGLDGHLLRRQQTWSLVALVAALALTFPNYRWLGRTSYVFLAACVLTLVVVFLMPPVNGAHRWIRIGPLGWQPSELTKLAFVLALARYLMHAENFRRLTGLLWPLAAALVPILLILREPDLGTALVFFPVFAAMVLAAGARWRDLLAVAFVGFLMLPLLWSQMSREQRSRVTALWEQNSPGQPPTADGYQLHQAKQLAAFGGLGGSWLTRSGWDDAVPYRLPAAHTDFVLSVLSERAGLCGAAAVLAAYLILVLLACRIARDTREPFGRLTAAGIAALFAVQVLINSAMAVGLAPVTGLSLPLVSYGGSGLVAHALAIGLLLNIGMRPGYEVANDPFRYRAAAH